MSACTGTRSPSTATPSRAATAPSALRSRRGSRGRRSAAAASSLGNSGATSVGGILRRSRARRSLRYLGLASIRSCTSFACMPASTSAHRSARSSGPQPTARSKSRGLSPASATTCEYSTPVRDLLFPPLSRSRRRSIPAPRSSRATSSHSPATPAFRPAPTSISSSIEPRSRRPPAPSGLRTSDRGGFAEGPRHRDRGSLGIGEVSAGEIAAFPAIKAYLDQEIASLVN